MNWIDRVLSGELGAEEEVVSRYSLGLLAIARRELPHQIQSRLDPEDIVQSVYRSFFRRLNRNEFQFDESLDVWRLLVVMTYHRVKNAVKHHRRQQRNMERDVSLRDDDAFALEEPTAKAEDLKILIDLLERLLADFPETSRRIVELRMEGYRVAEVAEQCSVSQRTVIRVMNRVRERAQLLHAELDDD